MSVLGGCRILQDTPSPFHVHRGQGHLAQTLFPHFDNACWCCVVACVLDKQHHERFHSPGITSSVDMFCSLSPEAGKRNRRIYCIQLSDIVLMDASGDGANRNDVLFAVLSLA
uniref:Uncharacterized protein n=1 Tax=Oryza meridionalis TaxID=40149 RepID=A0A0E0DB76_9ORYZ